MRRSPAFSVDSGEVAQLAAVAGAFGAALLLLARNR